MENETVTIGKVIDFSRWGKDHKTAEASPVPYLEIEGEDEPTEFLFDYKGAQLIAQGNLQACKGREKTGKSAAGVALMAAALGGGFLDIKPRKEISTLWIDTEQDKNTLRQRARAVLGMAGKAEQPDTLHIVTLKGAAAAERVKLTLQAIEETAPDFVFLDGAADLCEDWNDNKESARVTDTLLKATEQHGCSILCVIHTNKKDDEARGHLGTILQQKSSEVYELTRAGDVAQVRQQLCRFAGAPPIRFRFADNFTIEAVKGVSEARAREDELQLTFGEIFADNEAKEGFRYKDLVSEYAEIKGVGVSAAKKAVAAAVAVGVLIRNGQSKGRRYSFMYPLDYTNEL